MTQDPEWTDTEGASHFTSIPAATLTTMRSRGGGPQFFKVGSAVRYSFSALRKWMEEQRVAR